MGLSIQRNGSSFHCSFEVSNQKLSTWLSTKGETLRGVAFKHFYEKEMFQDLPAGMPLTNSIRVNTGITQALVGFGLLGATLLGLGITVLSFKGMHIAYHHATLVTNRFGETYHQFSGRWHTLAYFSALGAFFGSGFTLVMGGMFCLAGLPLGVYGSAYLAKCATCYGTGSLMKSSAKLFQPEATEV